MKSPDVEGAAPEGAGIIDETWLVARFEDGQVVFDPACGDTHWLAHETAAQCAPARDAGGGTC